MATIHYMNAAKDIYEPEFREINDFYSVEIKIDSVGFMYQFKLWKTPSEPTFLVVKEGSGFMEWIHPGDILPMTYCSDSLTRPKQQLPTRILNIHRQNEGRFRGHYVVKLGIVEN